MIGSWLTYGAALLGGGLFYLFYPGYLSFYLLILILALPILSLLLTLPLRRAFSLTLTPEGSQVRLTLHAPKFFQTHCLKVTYRVENLLYPQLGVTGALYLTPKEPEAVELTVDHCGWLRLTPVKCALPDFLGLFALPIPLPAPLMARVLPPEEPLPSELDLSPRQGLTLHPKPGGGPGEEHELRPYRPGDSVQSIHWKLTAKQPEGDPILRETMEPARENLAVTYDHFGAPDRLDQVLGQLRTLSQLLLDQERPFTLVWTSPETGAPTYHQVNSPEAWKRCLSTLLAQPAPLSGTPSHPLPPPGQVGSVRWVRLEPKEVETP